MSVTLLRSFRNFCVAFAAYFLCAGALAPQQLRNASLGNFQLENEQVIQNVKIGYRIIETLNWQKSNAVILPKWFSGTTKQLVDLVGPGKLVDSSKYYVVLIDALGDGISSSPSSSKGATAHALPRI